MKRMYVVSLITEPFSREDAGSSLFFWVSKTQPSTIIFLFHFPGCEDDLAVASVILVIARVDLADTTGKAAVPFLPHYFLWLLFLP